MKPSPGLLASCWTLAGDVVPLAGSMVSPRDFRARAEAAGRAGYVGMGLYVDDLVQVRERYGDAQIRRILADNGLRYLELEALMDWFADGARRAASDRTRRLLLDAAQRLGARHIKVMGDMTGVRRCARPLPAGDRPDPFLKKFSPATCWSEDRSVG